MLTYCQLTDVNGHRHVWTWCEPCYRIITTVPKSERPPWLKIDELPVYQTRAQRGTSATSPKPRAISNPLQPTVDEYRRLLRSLPYDIYLQTEHWANKRTEAIRSAGGKCQLCNSTKRINVHHRTYDHRGDEPMSDLTVLCRECHAKFHYKLP